jgi:ribA/ribD-fused uncharacterized protein
MFFKDEYAFLSNMYKCLVLYEDHLFGASEIAYVYMKCADPEQRHQVTLIKDPYEAKRFGGPSGTLILRYDWEEIKVKIMHDIVREKFKQNANLLKRLLMIAGDIVEENWWHDTFWGVCKGVGQNHLGNIHMLVREELR